MKTRIYLTLFFLSLIFLSGSRLSLSQHSEGEERGGGGRPRSFVLEGNEVHLGYLLKRPNETVYEEVRVIRNSHTEAKVFLTYFFKFGETVCAERRYGGYPGLYYYRDYYDYDYYDDDDDFEGPYCARWREVTTSRAGKVLLDFSRANRLRGTQTEKFIISFRQLGERSTYVSFNGRVERAKGPYRIEKIWSPVFIGAPSPIGLKFQFLGEGRFY